MFNEVNLRKSFIALKDIIVMKKVYIVSSVRKTFESTQGCNECGRQGVDVHY